jgi:hypothetical protein
MIGTTRTRLVGKLPREMQHVRWAQYILERLWTGRASYRRSNAIRFVQKRLVIIGVFPQKSDYYYFEIYVSV